ncbi:MAG: hypothetical protein Q8P91_00700 [bacterium]|nr:hypothetical protein [bacterium]
MKPWTVVRVVGDEDPDHIGAVVEDRDNFNCCGPGQVPVSFLGEPEIKVVSLESLEEVFN